MKIYPHAIVASLFFIFMLTQVPSARSASPKASICHAGSARIFLPTIHTGIQLFNGNGSVAATHRSDGEASWGSPIAVSPTDGAVWTVNPDSGSVSVIDPQAQTKITEVVTGEEPWSLTIAPDGKYVYVADRASGDLTKIDARSYEIVETILVGPELGTIALSPSGKWAYITLMSNDEIAVIETATLRVANTVPVDRAPYAIGVTDDGDADDYDEQILVTHFFGFQTADGVEATDDGREGRVTLINTCTHDIISTITLSPDLNGFPNLLAGISIHQQRAWIALVRAAPDLPTTLTTTAFAAVSTLDLSSQLEQLDAALPLNDQDIFGSPINNPVMTVPSPNGDRLYVVAAGSDMIEVVNVADPIAPSLIGFLPVGKNPRGMVLSADGAEGYVLNYLARSVSILDLTEMKSVAEVIVTDEPLDAETLRGKILFNNAVDPRLSRGSWISCASCHPDGGTDSVTWMFPDGPRQTPPIWNAIETLPWHWSAALDEAQDVEETIHIIQHGLGLAAGADPAQLGAPNAERSADLDALAAFMAQGIRVPTLPAVDADVVEAGRLLFQSAGCSNCHGGVNWTDSTLPATAGNLDEDGNGMIDTVLHDVGTLNLRDLRGKNGFDSPSLLNVQLTAPYLHDGSMSSLLSLLRSGHPSPNGNESSFLNAEEITNLFQFLRTIDSSTRPID